MDLIAKSVVIIPLMAVFGCAALPSGPSVMVLPGSAKTFDQFRADDSLCRQFAQAQIGGTDANQASTEAGVRSATIGTVLGAVAGALVGGHHGAGVGAGTGLLVGAVAGGGAAQTSAIGTQQRYDNAYAQCMFAKGERVPVVGAVPRARVQAFAIDPPSGPYAPPLVGVVPSPPPGYPPPPPPGVSSPPLPQ